MAISDLSRTAGWTTDDLDQLPEDGIRRELLDGVLLVSPSPTDIHQIIAMRLGVALEESCPDELQVTQGVEIRINSTLALIPDVLVATDEAAQRGGRFYSPHEVVLAVEIVSPGSQSIDRVLKPALYAKAGIPHYWLIETDGEITVQTFRLDSNSEVYDPAGSFTDVIRAGEPWPIEIPIAGLRPRNF